MRDYSKNYQFYYKGDDQIVANVWNADKDWKIEVYENGIKTPPCQKRQKSAECLQLH